MKEDIFNDFRRYDIGPFNNRHFIREWYKPSNHTISIPVDNEVDKWLEKGITANCAKIKELLLY